MMFCKCEKKIAELEKFQIETQRQVVANSKHIYYLKQQVDTIDQVLYRLLTGQALSAKLTIDGELMPATIAIGGNGGKATFTEFTGLNGTGSVIAPSGPVAFASSDIGVATIDSASGVITPVGPGTATISGADSVSGLSASDTVTVIAALPPVAQSATLVVSAL